jgi:hypothetical protein
MAGRDLSSELFGPGEGDSQGRDLSDELFGAKPAARTVTEADKERTIGESIKDVGAGLVGGLGSIVQVPGQLYGLATGDFSKTGLLGAGERLSEYGEEMKSEGLKAREAERAKIVEEASKEGQFAAFKAALGETITDPGLLAGFLAEQAPQVIPMILAGGGAGYIAKRGVMSAAAARGAAVEAAERLAQKKALQAGTTGAIQTGAVMQGADIGAGSYDDIVAGLIEQGATPEQAAEEAINKARLAGVTGYGLSVLANRYLPGGKALEEILAGKRLAGSRLGGAALTGLKEIPSENIEEVGGRIAQNIAARSAGLDREILEGTGETAAMATLGAAGIGGAAGALSVRPEAVKAGPDEFDKELAQFRQELGPEGDAPAQVQEEIDTGIDAGVEEQVAAAPVAKPPVQLPGGFTATERELSREVVPEAFGIFPEGGGKPLATVGTQEDAQKKLESLTQIRQEEQKRLSEEFDKINSGIFAEQRKLEVMEATGQADTDQYVQAKAELDLKEQEAAEKLTDIRDRIAAYSTPLTFAPMGQRTAVQSEVIVNRGDEVVGVFPSFEAAQSTVQQLAPEEFKQADIAARTQAVEAVLKPAFAKFNLGDIGLNIVEAIKTGGGGRADGAYAQNLIQIALDAPEPLQTMRHETVHALKELGFFTKQQWRALTEQANKTWVKQYLEGQVAELNGVQMSRLDAYKELAKERKLSPRQLREEIIEEAIADAFGAYARGATPPPGLIATLYKKLASFFANFGQALRGAGFESAEDIFQRIERGDLKSKAPKKEAKPVVKAKEAEKAPETKKAEAPEAEVRAAQEKAKKEKYSLAGTGVPMSTRNLMEQQTPIAQQDLGLNTEAGRSGTNNVRDIAKALNRQTLDQLGAMKRNKLTQDDSTMISEAIADEVAYQLQTSSKTGTGLGWYSHNYPNAVKRLGKRFPELSTSKYARSVFSALVAVTSNGERVTKNIDNAIKLYADLRKGKRLVVMGNRRATALENNLQVIQDLMAEHGENFEKVLLKEITVSEMNARLRKMGKKADGSYLANTVVPAAAVYFGPKLGAFYANLSGSEGYLTMDLWWTRSINRMRGLLIPKATSASISKFRDMMDSPDATRDEVVAATIPLRNKYEEYGWNSELEHLAGAKEPSTKAAKPAWFEKAEAAAGDAYEQLLFEHNLEKMANTIYKNEFEMLEEAPFTATDRKFMYDAARKAQTLLRKNGVDLSLADIQAALWYYEKRLYAKLSGRKADDIGYEEAIIAQANQGSGRARPSVVFDKRTDRGDDSRGEVSGTEAVRGEPTRGAKLSLKKGVVAEVAPNPDHISAEKWREMTPTERLGATRSVANKVMSSVFSELGLRGYSYSFSTGTYEGEVNPNIIVEAPQGATEQELEELGRVLGYVLDQKAMVVFDEDNKTSGSQAGFVKVVVPDDMTAEQFDELRQHIAQKVPQADGDTLRNGALLYGNFSAYNDNVDTLTDAQYQKAIVKAVESFTYDGVIDVSKPETFHSSLIWPKTRSDYLKETRYGDSSRVQGEAGADVRGQGSRRLQAISEEGIALRDRWIDGRGAARLGGRERGNAVDFGKPTAEYGTPRQGSVSATGIHFSKQQRPEISSGFYGTGLRGLERERLAEKENADIRDRIYFYVDNGKGVTPESGVGGIPHVIKLNNLYDTSADPLQIVKNIRGESSADRASKRERAIKKAGFDGYLVKDPIASQDYALLIGKHAVKTGKYSLKNVRFPSVKAVKEAVAQTEVPDTPEFKRFIAGNQWTEADGKPTVFYHATAREFLEFTPAGQSQAIFLATTPEEAETFGSAAEDKLRREIYEKLLNKDQKLSFFQGVVDAQVKKGAITEKQGREFMRQVDRKAPKYGDFGDIEQEVYDALLDLSPTRMSIMPLWARAETPFDFENEEHVEQVMQWVTNNTDYPQEFPEKWLSGLKGRIKQGLWQAIEDKRVQMALRRLGFDSFTVRENRNSPKNYAVYQPEQVKSVTGNSGEFDRAVKNISYSLRSFRKEELPQKARDYTLPANTLLYHGAYKERADRIEEMGSVLLSRPPMRVSGGFTAEGDLIFFGDENTAQNFASNKADPRAVQDARDAGVERLPGKVFETATDRPYELINRDYKMNAKEAKALTKALGLPDYKALSAGLPLEVAVTRAIDYDNSKIDRYEVTRRTGQGKEKISAPWPVIFRTLGVDGFYDSLGVALTANNGIKLVGKDGKLEKYSLPSIPAAAQVRIEETTTVRQEKGFARRIVEAISPKSVAHFRAEALNRYNQLSVYDKKLAEKMGGAALLADQSAESAALMSDLASGVVASAMGTGNRTGGIPVLRNGITTIDSSVKGLVASLAPLAAYGDPVIYRRYQYWAMVKRGVRLNAQGKNVGITAADVAFAKMLEQKHPEFVSVQKDLIKFNNGLVKYMVDTGVLSKGRAAEYTKYADYVPFYRQMDGETTVGPNLFQSISGVRPPKKLKGGDAPLADFLETMVRNTAAAIQAGAKNYAGQRAINVVQQVKAPGMGATRLNKVSNAPDVINVLENGELVSYQTPDELLLYAVKSLNLSDIPYLSFVSAPADLLRNLVTKDPGFMMANLLRDSLSAYVTSGQKMTPVVDTVISFGKALADKSPATRALLDAGIISGYDAGDIESSGIRLEEDLAKKAGKRRDSIFLRPFKSVWDGLEAGTTASDAATRAVIYDRVLAETGNEAEALFRALEVMNFHRKGGSSLIRILTAAVPFFNARLQGLDLFYRASTGNMNTSDAAAIRNKFWARGMTMMGLSVAYWFMVSDDEEYKKQEQETRDNNWLIPSLGMRIPIPFEVGVLFKTIPERIAAYTFGDDTGQDLRDSLARSAVSTFAFNPIPQTVKPVFEAAFDFNTFTWRPILSEGMKDVDPQFQVGPGTSSVAKGIAGALGLSPIKVDHVIKGYTGTMGMYAIDTIDMVTNQFSDTPKATKRFEQLPVIKRFALDPEARGNVTEYYKLKDSVDGVVRTMNFLEKQQESEEFVDYLKKNQGTLAFKDYIRDTEKTMKELRDARNAIRISTMSGDEKRDALVEIGRAESAITGQIQRIKQAIASAQ